MLAIRAACICRGFLLGLDDGCSRQCFHLSLKVIRSLLFCFYWLRF